MAEDTNDTLVSAMKHLVGDSDPVCRLCFCIIQREDDKVALEDTVTLQRSFYVGTITFQDMFMTLGINMLQSHLPSTFCINCSMHTINAYLFKMLCQYSQQEWEFAVDKLSSSLPTDDKFTTKKSIILFPNAKSNVTTFKAIKKANAYEEIRDIISSRIKYQKSKSKKLIMKLMYCDQCPIGFGSLYDLKKHTARHKHTNKQQMAPFIKQEPVASIKQETVASTKQKTVASIKQEVFYCDVCLKTFSSNYLLLIHTERKHLPKVFPCQKCDVKVSTERLLKIHWNQKHLDIKCDICHMVLPSKHALTQHLDTHTSGYNCPRCNKHFTKRNSLSAHQTICGVQNKPNFFCDLCGKAYVRKRGLTGHMVVEHGFGTAVHCPWCDKKFGHESRLKLHIVKHTRERNFSCEICGGVFVTQPALTYHIRLHTGEKPYECDVCGEKFLSSSRRMEHKRRRHLGPSKACTYCQQLFVTSHEMKKHMRRHFNPNSKLYCPVLEA